MLQHRSKDSADENHDEHPHDHAGQTDTEVKAGMKQDDGKAERAEPEMSAHPGLSSAQTPDGHLLPRAQGSRKQHECRTDAAVGKSHRASASSALQGVAAVDDVNHGCDDQSCQAADEPLAMGAVNAQESLLLLSGRRLLQQAGKKFRRINAVRRVVRTGVDTTRLGVVQT